MKKLITEQLQLKQINLELAQSIAKEHGIKEEDVSLIRKGLIPADTKFEEGDRSAISYITTSAVDRDKEIVDPKGAMLKDYRKHPVVLFGHDYSKLPIGKNEWIKADDKGLIAKTVYANTPEADKVYQYRKDGFPLAESIGFVPIKFRDFDEVESKLHKGAKRIYDKWILLEYSDVTVPSNPEALQIAISKGLLAVDDTLKQKFNCECIECGYKIQSEKHCKDLKCIKCGGQMRRAERPGPGQAGKDENKLWEDNLTEIQYQIRTPKLFEPNSFSKILIKSNSPKIFGIVGKLKGETAMTIQSLRFLKNANDDADGTWTLDKAKSWVEDHLDIKSAKLEVILLKLLKEEEEPYKEIEKAGRVLSQKNRSLIKTCIDALSKLHEATEPEPKKELKKEYTKEYNEILNQISDILKQLK